MSTPGGGWERAVVAAPPRRRPSLAVFKLASCDGCQLSLLDCEDEILEIADLVEIADFAEMSSARRPGPYDVVLVEGSVTTPADLERITRIRQDAGMLVAIGACATTGGIQALRNFADEPEFARLVYAHPEYLQTLASATPVSAHVRVDAELHGCPIDRRALLEFLAAALSSRRPLIPAHAVCEECKRAGRACVLVAGGTPCLGPVTRAGCGALCPGLGRGCFGCFGPAETANTASLAATLRRRGTSGRVVRRLFSTVTAAAPPFAEQGAGNAER